MRIYTRLRRDEIPSNYEDFLTKWENDHIFRNRAKCMGFEVSRKSKAVTFPNGMVYPPQDLLK